MGDDLVVVTVPLISPNEPESLLADLPIKEGERVEKGQVLATFETTKSTFELTAEADGFVLGLRLQAGDTARAGERMCYLAPRADTQLPASKVDMAAEKPDDKETLPDGLRITQPALALAREYHIDLNTLPKGRLVTEGTIKDLGSYEIIEDNPTALLIYGGGGHAKSLIDLIRMVGRDQIAGIVDDGIPAGTLILDVPVLGGGEMLPVQRRKGVFRAVNAVGGIGSIAPRLAVYKRLSEAGFQCVTGGSSRRIYRANCECGGWLPGLFQCLYRQRGESWVWEHITRGRSSLTIVFWVNMSTSLRAPSWRGRCV